VIKISDFKEKDFSSVKNLLINGFSKNFDNDINLNFINDQSNFGFVAVNNETIIGFASIHIIEKLNRRSCLIEDVVVDKNERGKGIGKLLIEHLINFSKSKSCDKIILNSKESNIPFYNKLGFVQNEIQMIIRN
jgi:GNAT superfamily N-acetyltransferase|tara:strand:+ start:187 stop:588 length:402 start_codon:yes stop_codon:yes gene_type:complete